MGLSYKAQTLTHIQDTKQYRYFDIDTVKIQYTNIATYIVIYLYRPVTRLYWAKPHKATDLEYGA